MSSSDRVLAGGWTRATLAVRSPEERHRIWGRARKMGDADALELASVIEDLGLMPAGVGGLKMDDPLTLAMFELINRPEGRAACLKATDEGWPAIAGVDPMLRAEFGDQYSPAHRATVTAGILVGELMRILGYEHDGDRDLPPNSVATTGAFWRRRSEKSGR